MDIQELWKIALEEFGDNAYLMIEVMLSDGSWYSIANNGQFEILNRHSKTLRCKST